MPSLSTVLRVRSVVSFHGNTVPRLSFRLRSISKSFSTEAARVLSKGYATNSDSSGRDWWKIYKNKREKNPFEEDEDGSLFAQSLLAAVPVDYEDGGKNLGLKMITLDNAFPGVRATKNLITRKHTRDVLDELLRNMDLHGAEDMKERFAHAVIEGAPGIGKSFSLLWLLRELLLRGEKVVFDSIGTSSVYQFVPPRLGDGFSDEEHFVDGLPRYHVFRCEHDDFRPGKCATLYDPQAFYLFDPNEKTGEAKHVEAHTITAASPNSAHYDNRRNSFDRWYFMSPWTLPEVMAVAPVLGKDYLLPELRKEGVEEDKLGKALEERVREAFYVCGGSLRNIFRRDLSLVEKLQNQAISSYLTEIKNEGAVRAMFDPDGIIDGELVPQKSSRIFAYWSESPFTRENTQRSFVSARVSHELALKYRKMMMLSVRELISESENAAAGHYFEHVALGQLARGGGFRSWNAPVTTLQAKVDFCEVTLILKAVDKKNLCHVRGHGEHLATVCARLPSVEEQNADRTLPRLLYASDDPNFKVLDFVDAKDRGYQITVSKVHDMKPHAAYDFLKAVGATEDKPFHLYLVVPSFIANTKSLASLTQSISGITEFRANYPTKYDYLSKCLKHHVLVIDDLDKPKRTLKGAETTATNAPPLQENNNKSRTETNGNTRRTRTKAKPKTTNK